MNFTFRNFRLIGLYFVGVALASPITALGVDLDENGIEDTLDQQLINAYCPTLHFSSSEKYWPCSVDWFVKHSQLEGPVGCREVIAIHEADNSGWPVTNTYVITDHGVIFDNTLLTIQPLLILSCQASAAMSADGRYIDVWGFKETGAHCGRVGSSLAQGYCAAVGYHLNIDDAYHHGQFVGDQGDPANGTPCRVGTYAHVVQLDHASISNISTKTHYPRLPELQVGDLLVQYWQFFAFNDAEQVDNAGNHEGDILFLEVYLHRWALTSQSPAAMKYIVYHHHGDGQCDGPTVIPGEYWVPAWPLPIRPTYFPLPQNGHPDCYLESGAHEWWPWSSRGGECEFDIWGPMTVANNPHSGSGLSYLTENILNLGQLFAPMPGTEPQLFLHFNGRWGTYNGPGADPPDPPAFQFYPGSPLFVGYVDATASSSNCPVGAGSKYFPYRLLSDAQSAVEQTIAQMPSPVMAGRILLGAGNYAGDYIFTKPLILEAWGSGTATIGQ
jgi:hypothetical protein